MKTLPLSITMQAALEYAGRHGGELHRLPGHEKPRRLFGASTIRALVTRGWMDYSAWKQGLRGPKFPIACKVVNDDVGESTRRVHA